MKKNILICFCLFSICCSSQKYLDTLEGFKFEGDELVWQKVFDSIKHNDTQRLFKKSAITNLKKNNLLEIDSTITFEVNNDEIEFRKYGGKWGNTPIFVQYPQDYLVIAEFKKGKYRITIKSIESDMSEAGAGKSELNDLLHVTKNKQFRNNKYNKKVLRYYNLTFISRYKIKIEKDDW